MADVKETFETIHQTLEQGFRSHVGFCVMHVSSRMWSNLIVDSSKKLFLDYSIVRYHQLETTFSYRIIITYGIIFLFFPI